MPFSTSLLAFSLFVSTNYSWTISNNENYETLKQKEQETLRVVTITMICSTLDLFIKETYT